MKEIQKRLFERTAFCRILPGGKNKSYQSSIGKSTASIAWTIPLDAQKLAAVILASFPTASMLLSELT